MSCVSRLLLPLVLTAGLLAGCGGSDSAGEVAQTVQEDAAEDGSLRFASAAVTARPGAAVIEMANPSSIPHAIAIRGDGVDERGPTAGGGATSRVEADLRAGSYTLYCPVAGHEQAGMTARLTVR
jgi:plastocyanin